MYRICIAGSREFDDYALMEKVVCDFAKEQELENEDVTIVSGTARGADKLGERIANDYGLGLEEYPADWDKYGKSAGYRRNEEMAEVSDAVLIFWDESSPGTKHMIDSCRKRDLLHWVIKYRPRIEQHVPEDTPPWE